MTGNVGHGCATALTPRQQPARSRGWRRVGTAVLLATSAAVTAVVGIAPSANAEPADIVAGPANSVDTIFIQDLNQIGIPYPSESEAVNSARIACAQIAGGSSIKDAVAGVRDANPALSVLQGAHFVWITRNVYCPGHREPL